MVTLRRIIVAGWQHFVRNSGLSLATVFVIATMISLIATMFLVKGVANFMIDSLQEKVDISVYFNQDVIGEDILKIKDDAIKLNEVKSVVYVSREEALSRFMTRYKDNSVVIEALSEVGNPLMASLNIRATEAGKYQQILQFFDGENYRDIVVKIDYYERQPIINRVFAMVNNINRIGLIIAVIIALFAILITFNTIRLAIYDSRNEIGIMRIVGASNLFIHAPFLVQGSIAGFFAFSFSILTITIISYLISPKIENILPGFDLFNYLSINFSTVFLIQLFSGIGLGVIGSAIAVRKYLRV
ncbi:MAG: permease-like cell division protein FtsX [bacterium]